MTVTVAIPCRGARVDREVRLGATGARRLPIARPNWFHRLGGAPQLVTAGPPPRVVRVRAADTFVGDGGWHGVDEGDRRGG
jgi:hypothetical protein